MAYIGVQPRLGNFQACDAITASATTTFNLLVGGTAIFPQSAQHCLVSLNGVLQAPISSYTISGSTIIFAAALTTDDSIDFITILGDTLDLGTPSDSTVTSAKLNTALLTGATDIGAAIADADLFLVDDGAGGTLRKTAASRIKTYVGGGITMADQWRLVTDRASDEDPIGSSSTLERVDDASFGKIGTGMTNTSGIFSFPETGTYLVKAKGEGLQSSADDNNFDMEIMATIDNSSYDRTVFMRMGFTSAPNTANVNGSCLVNVDNISNVKVKFKLGSSNSNTLKGNTAYNRTFFTFIRLGDST